MFCASVANWQEEWCRRSKGSKPAAELWWWTEELWQGRSHSSPGRRWPASEWAPERPLKRKEWIVLTLYRRNLHKRVTAAKTMALKNYIVVKNSWTVSTIYKHYKLHTVTFKCLVTDLDWLSVVYWRMMYSDHLFLVKVATTCYNASPAFKISLK